jgi:hypothetical protein
MIRRLIQCNTRSAPWEARDCAYRNKLAAEIFDTLIVDRIVKAASKVVGQLR